MIAELRESYPTAIVCCTFDVKRSSFYEWIRLLGQWDARREALKAKVVELYAQSRESMGSRMVSRNLNAQNIRVGRALAATLMKEANIVSKQRGHIPLDLRGLKLISRLTCLSASSPQLQLVRSGAGM